MHGAPIFTLQLSFVGHQLTLDVNNQSLGTRYCIEGYYSLLDTNFRGLSLIVGHQFSWVIIDRWAPIFVGYH